MLVKFSLRNYKVFREKAELSLIASPYDKDTLPENTIDLPKFGLRLLKSAVVYGANASGKSKLIEALGFLSDFVRNSSKESQVGEEIPVDPFRLSTETENEPTEMELVFINEDVLYRYGFEITRQQVVAEWLYYKPHTKEVELFYRDADKVENHPKLFGGIVNQLIKGGNVRKNALLVSLAAQFNISLAEKVVTWFSQDLNVVYGLKEETYRGLTVSQLADPARKKAILQFLQDADIGIEDLFTSFPLTKEVFALAGGTFTNHQTMKSHFDSLFPIEAYEVHTRRRKFDENRIPTGLETFSMKEDESSGTQKLFALAGRILTVLEKGDTLVVDEMDAKLHPNLVCKLVDVFHSPVTNPNNAQLIFNTHDTNLLSAGSFRRDQIWFTEKDRYGAATLYSLADFKVRKDRNFEENYIRGKYGAIPYLGDFTKLFSEENELTGAGTEE